MFTNKHNSISSINFNVKVKLRAVYDSLEFNGLILFRCKEKGLKWFIWERINVMENYHLNIDYVDANGEHYRLKKVIDHTATNIHHIISRKKQNKFNVKDERNLIRMRVNKHIALNQLFNDKQTPKEQLKVMYDIWKTTLDPEVQQTIEQLISMEDSEFYLDDLVKWKKKKSWLDSEW